MWLMSDSEALAFIAIVGAGAGGDRMIRP